jgi:hypothetical protein
VQFVVDANDGYVAASVEACYVVEGFTGSGKLGECCVEL